MRSKLLGLPTSIALAIVCTEAAARTGRSQVLGHHVVDVGGCHEAGDRQARALRHQPGSEVPEIAARRQTTNRAARPSCRACATAWK